MTNADNLDHQTRPVGRFLSLRGAESEPKPPRRFASALKFWNNAKKKQNLNTNNSKEDDSRRRRSWAGHEEDDDEALLSRRRFDVIPETKNETTSTRSSPATSAKTAPECIGTVFHQTWNESKQDPDLICQEIREFCESPRLQEFCIQAGLIEPTFEWSSHMCPRSGLLHFRKNEIYTRFWEECQANPDRHMAVVFHGTTEENVPRVLKYGLDPKYRRTQAFGKGEYFSKEAGLATTYCQGGHKMVVYLVLLPPDNDPKWSQRDRDIVVVDHIEHELPIGVVTHQGVDQQVVKCSQQVRVQQAFYKNQAVEKERLAKEERRQHHDDNAKQLEEEAKEAWQHYHEMREDELRNIHLSRYVDPSALVFQSM